jgi:hypothetical protein
MPLRKVPAIAPISKEGGRKAAVLLAARIAIVILAALALVAASRTAAAGGGPMISIDMTPGAAGLSSANPIDTCAQVSVGDDFDADVYVSNVDSLVEWELRIDYDPNIVSLDSADFNYLLVQSGGSVFPSEFEQEKPGRMFLAAAEPHSPDSGSGTLARLHLHALSSGTSPISITASPTVYGPRLVAAGGTPFGDTNGDGIWDSAISGGMVTVGGGCAASTPVPTPPSSSASSPTPGPRPGDTTPGPDGSTPGSGSDTGASTPVDITGGQSSPGAAGEVSPGNLVNKVGGSDQNSGSDPGEGSSGQSGANGAPEPTSGDQNQQANSGQTSNWPAPWVIIGGVLTALTVLVGGMFVVFRAPWNRPE